MKQTRQDPERKGSRRRKGALQLTVQIIGEILITLGIILALFVAWQLWWTNVETSTHQKLAIESFFADSKTSPKPSATPEASENNSERSMPEELTLDAGSILGIMYVPRFGEDYTRPIIEGTTPEMLDTLGLGHYTNTALPGEIGNFAVAGHRQTHGAVFDNIHTLVPGDKIYVQTKDAYFTYIFKSSEIVLPQDTEVILPVPNEPTAKPSERLLTMTTCHPRYGSEERFIAYSKLEETRSITEGPPGEIKDQVKKASGEN